MECSRSDRIMGGAGRGCLYGVYWHGAEVEEGMAEKTAVFRVGEDLEVSTYWQRGLFDSALTRQQEGLISLLWRSIVNEYSSGRIRVSIERQVDYAGNNRKLFFDLQSWTTLE